MTGYDRLRAVTAQRAAGGLTEPQAAMLAIVLEVMALAGYVPEELRRAVVAASTRWFLGVSGGEALEPMRAECWHYLDRRHGNSTTVADLTDLAVRGLICVLYNDEPELEDIEMTFDYFGALMDRFGREIGRSLGGVG